MEKKEFLNEENYHAAKKKIIRISLIILIVGVLLGGSLIITGIVKTNIAKKDNEDIANKIDNDSSVRTEAQVQADIDATKAKIDAIEKEINQIDLEISKLRTEQQKILTEDHGFSDRYYAKDEEIKLKAQEKSAKLKEKSELDDEVTKYESELWKIQSGYNDVQTEIEKSGNLMDTAKYIPLYMIGGFIIIASCIISGSIYLFAKRREITSFTIQQTMPVAQEAIDKMAPTVGNAVGNIAQGITKGIKDGLKDDKE